MSQVYLATGANSGLGLDSVRRLALLPETSKVYMGCRSEEKAKAAIDSLKGLVDTAKLEYVHFDASQSKQEIAKILKASTDKDGFLGPADLVLHAGPEALHTNPLRSGSFDGHVVILRVRK